jgi:hypothetical protein
MVLGTAAAANKSHGAEKDHHAHARKPSNKPASDVPGASDRSDSQ